MAEPQNFKCPHCGDAIQATPGDEAVVVACPSCGSDMEIPAVEKSESDATRDDELDIRRIKLVTQQRRELNRDRKFALIGAIACFVAAAQLVYTAIRLIRAAGLGNRAIAYLISAFVALVAAVACWRHAGALASQARQSSLSEPTTPPDFSSLGDGSERWKNLEDVR